MDEPKTIDDLLRVDETCAKESEVVFVQLGSNAMDCANAGLRVFAAAAVWLREYHEHHPLGEYFSATATELGIRGEELWEIVRTPPEPGEDSRIAKARGLDEAVGQAIGLRTVLQLCWRAYRWGLADLRRLKLTATSGYLRVEAESLALMVLFAEKPELAGRWVNPNEDMVKFFRETQPTIRTVLKRHSLTAAYEHGSAVAQHARFASAARGIRLGDGEAFVLDQEFDPENPVTFHLGLAYFLRVNRRIFEVLPSVLAGLADDEPFTSAFNEFRSLEEKTWWVMERKYAEEIKDFYVE